jgi:hypothetical protein
VIADSLGVAGGAVVVVAGVVVALGTLWRMVLRPMGIRLGALGTLIERELTPNGGDSLRDQVDGLTTSLADHVADEAAAAAELRARLEALTTAVEAMTAWARAHDHMHEHLEGDHR